MPEWSSGFPYFVQFTSEFGNKEFMIWATVSSQSCFCWLYRPSPSLAAKNIINLTLVLTIWWCPCVESCVVGRGCLLWPVHSLGKTLLAFHLEFSQEKIYTLPYIKYLNKKDLLCNTVNYTFCKNLYGKRIYRRIYITESLCYIPEINTTW